MADTARAKKPTGEQPAGVSQPIPLRRRKTGSGFGSPSGAPFGRLIVVGNGMVSRRLCEALLRAAGGRELPEVVVFGDETRPAYDRVHLGDVLRGRSPESLLLSPPSWYLGNGIRLHLGDAAVSVDLADQVVTSRRGHRLRYDRLVLATGAAPVVPSMVGDRNQVFLLRSLDDMERLRDRSARARRVVVIGGGLLGVETAAMLAQAGLKVALVEIGERLMRRHLDGVTAEWLRRTLVGQGIQVITGRGLSSVETQGEAQRVTLVGGLALEADVVVAAIGVRPRDQLGGLGLHRHPLGGYLVDDRLCTSVPQVFAIGDCAVLDGQRFGTVLPGYQMAEALAFNLLSGGAHRRFEPTVPTIRLKLPGMPLLLAGQVPASGWTARFTARAGYRALAVQDGALVAAVALGAWPEWNRVEQAVVGREPITDRQLRRFARGGELWPTPVPVPLVASADSIVCTCNLVSMRAVQAAIGDGARTLADVAGRTRACAGCGSCAPVVQAMLAGQQTQPVVRPLAGLLGSGLLVLLAAALPVLGLVPGLRARWLPAGWDFLWREPAAQQLTGFVAIGLFLAALLLPLRRKLGTRLPGRMNLWRTVHGLVGLLLVAALLVHTSARLGHGLNLAVSVAALSFVVAGALLALVWRRAPPQPGAATGLRPLHLALLWPALGLIAAHVLAVYFF